MRRDVRVAAMALTASVMTGLLTGCDSARVTVSRVVDGDTIDVVSEGEEQRVRLLNIDTPETVDPNEDVQCLGPEASAHLASLLPVGTEIELLADEEKMDSHGRLLAGIQLEDGSLVNAEMARAGLALPMQVGSNDRFLPEVEQANAEAIAAQRGLYDPTVGCTAVGQIAETEASAAALATAASSTTAGMADSGAVEAAAVVSTALALRSALDTSPRDGLVWKAARALPDRSSLTARIEEAASTARDNEAAHRTRAGELRTPPPAPPTAGRSGTTVRQPRATPSPSNERSEPRARTPERAPAPAPAPTAKPKPDVDASSGSGPAGYTGPRCYAPGGKTWKPC